MKYLFAVVVALAGVSVSQAQFIEINKSKHVKNPGTFCGWASLETLVRHHGYDQLKGLTNAKAKAQKDGHSSQNNWTKTLNKAKVPYVAKPPHTYNTSQLKGALVTVQVSNKDYHAIIVLGNNKDKYVLYDPNFPKQTMQLHKRQFHQCWVGNSLRVLPKR